MASSQSRGTQRPLGSSPHLHNIQQMLIALPEEGQDDPFKIPERHKRQIPEGSCLITPNGVDKTKWTEHSECSAAQPGLDSSCDSQVCSHLIFLFV